MPTSHLLFYKILVAMTKSMLSQLKAKLTSLHGEASTFQTIPTLCLSRQSNCALAEADS